MITAAITVAPGVDSDALLFGLALGITIGLLVWGPVLIFQIFRRLTSDSSDV